jgi:dihydrofolate synthase/folylpolyglutamate synthase
MDSSILKDCRNLHDWLAYLETLHPQTIALGLDRVREVFHRLAIKIDCPVITVAGTNGKGSTCGFLESMLLTAGYRVGTYTSPHLLRFNERIRISGREVTDVEICHAFDQVEAKRRRQPGTNRDAIGLTYFEFSTVAALWMFANAKLDIVILEVGLGGRLDAVNIVDPDVAVVTSIGIDHVEYLGATREAIGFEKSGIFRKAQVALCADPDPPMSILAAAERAGALLRQINIDYGCAAIDSRRFQYWSSKAGARVLPRPALQGSHQLRNAATAISALEALADRVAVDAKAIRFGIQRMRLSGRFQVLSQRPAIVLDVAHNPQAAASLAETLAGSRPKPHTFAVFGCMADKDISGVIEKVRAQIDSWLVATLPGPRGASASMVRNVLVEAGVSPRQVQDFASPELAFRRARELCTEAGRIVVFGSFLTVGAVLGFHSRCSHERWFGALGAERIPCGPRGVSTASTPFSSG